MPGPKRRAIIKIDRIRHPITAILEVNVTPRVGRDPHLMHVRSIPEGGVKSDIGQCA